LTVPYHIPVLRDVVVDYLQPRPGSLLVDGTLGGGGHSEALLAALGGSGRLVGIDQDADALREAGRRLGDYPGFVGVRGNFGDLEGLLDEVGVGQVDGVLLDLGISSRHVDSAERGFSLHRDGPLDMRMDRRAETSAAELLAHLDESGLEAILREYGEERFARRIARRIMWEREREPILTTGRLARIVEQATPAPARHGRIHPATRTFQALRIVVNDELGSLQRGLDAAVRRLAPGGRLVVISYHSLEDRLVKTTFRRLAGECTCPPRVPFCQCRPLRILRVLTRRPLEPDDRELAANPRARSARLRAAERLGPAQEGSTRSDPAAVREPAGQALEGG